MVNSHTATADLAGRNVNTDKGGFVFLKISIFICFSIILPSYLHAETNSVSKELLEDCLHKIHQGDKIYVYIGPREWSDSQNKNSFYSAENFFDSVTVENIKVWPEISGCLQINGKPVFVSRIYTKFGKIYSNLVFMESGNMNEIDPYYGSGILTEILYFDENGVYHRPKWVGLGMLGKEKILISFSEIGDEIYGCYKFVDGKETSRVFCGKVSNDNNVTLKYLGEKQRQALFSGKIFESRIIGSWKDNLGVREMDVAVSGMRESVLGYYQGTELDILFQDLEVYGDDNGTYYLHFNQGLEHETDLGLVGYLDGDGHLKWHCNGSKEYGSCGQSIYFQEGGQVETNCQGPSGFEGVCVSGTFKKKVND
jgi:hypothetical protein